MAVEAVDARHEAMLCLHRAICAVEVGDTHAAETHAQSAITWLHEVTSGHSLISPDISQEPDGWQYRP